MASYRFRRARAIAATGGWLHNEAMVEEPTLEDLNRRLAEIQDRLLELGRHDSAARYELHKERDHLRGLARERGDDGDARRSSQDLRAELDARKTALDEIKKGMVNTSGMAAGGGGGSDPTRERWTG